MFRNIDQRIGYHISIAARLIQNNYNQRLAEYDLTVAQAKVLYLLVNHGNQHQSELQNRLFIKGSTMNGIIDSMIKKQLIEKHDSETDRRSKLIVITEKGISLEEQLWSATSTMEDELTEGLTNEEKQLLLTLIKKIASNAKENY